MGNHTRMKRLALLILLFVAGSLVVAGPDADARRRKRCPANTTLDITVNPAVSRRQRSRYRAPTGVATPAACSFKTVGQAIASYQSRGLSNGNIILRGYAGTPVTLGSEVFPLDLPAGAALTTDDPGLDPTRYVINYRDGAPYAVSLSDAAIEGVTISSVRSTAASRMVICMDGDNNFDNLTLDGFSETGGGEVGDGLQVWPGCSLEGSRLRVFGFADDGVVVESGGTLTWEIGEVFRNDDDGVVVRGDITLGGPTETTTVSYNGGDGILVEATATGADFVNMRSFDNGDNGFEVFTSPFTLVLSDIFGNSRTSDAGPTPSPQLLFHGPDTYSISSASCAEANSIHGYDITDASATSVGLRVVDSGTVEALNTIWRSATPSQNATAGAGSSVSIDTTCATVGGPPPYDPPPLT